VRMRRKCSMQSTTSRTWRRSTCRTSRTWHPLPLAPLTRKSSSRHSRITRTTSTASLSRMLRGRRRAKEAAAHPPQIPPRTRTSPALVPMMVLLPRRLLPPPGIPTVKCRLRVPPQTINFVFLSRLLSIFYWKFV